MSDVFVSYARPDEAQAKQVAEALQQLGYRVWRDDELPAHRAYADVIEERLTNAKAVVALWSVEAAKSQWVRAEADAARGAGTLVQASLDGTIPPLPFNQIQCADLSGWGGDTNASGWRKLQASVSTLAGEAEKPRAPRISPRQLSVCVLPFQNMSGDAEQEYFSDGISEDITTDLSKVSALEVIARNTAFQFKGQSVDVCDLAKKLRVSHILEGSVRKSDNRVRITAQLIDGATGGHVWAERYDRDLTDIFAIQDEISKAIVAALKLKLLPEEKKAIENRGTSSAEAYDLYLMARQYWVSGNDGDPRRDEIVLRLCRNAIECDPGYARAWALMALAQAWMRYRDGAIEETGVQAAQKALLLDPNLPEPHCVMAGYFASRGRFDEADAEIETALRLDPDSWEANKEAAIISFRQGRLKESLMLFERAASLMENDYRSTGMMVTLGAGLDDREVARRAAEMTVERAERALSGDRSNGAALAWGAVGLAHLGLTDRAKQWMRRAMLVDPGNLIMRFNLACTASRDLKDVDAAIDYIEPFMAKATAYQIRHVEHDPDLDNIREDPRFQRMLEAAKQRIGIVDNMRASPVASAEPPRS
jgi:adenylate cyclase